MESIGRLSGLAKNWLSGHWEITFDCDKDITEEYQRLAGKDNLELTIKEHREKRSLDANAYFHVLVGKIADQQGISKARTKNMMICRYGQPIILEDGHYMIYKTNAPTDYMWEQESIHAIPVKYDIENGNEVTFYKIYRGSHEYNSKEMSILIDGVVSEAKELGIETMTPNQIERMKAAWKDS